MNIRKKSKLKKADKKYDSPYKQMFSNLTILKQLLIYFVNQDFIHDLDFDTFETINKSFTSKKYKDTESDLIVKFKLKNSDEEMYFYILLEFQSSVDKFMSVRILNYITSLYISMIETSKKKGETYKSLPPVFPIMLYNGNETWTSKENISELIENNDLLGDYGINFKYFKIAENEFSKETLESIRNIVSTLFLFESKQKVLDIELLRNEIKNLFKNEKDNIALSLLTNYFKNILTGDKMDNRYDLLNIIYSNENEASSMFADLVNQERIKLKEEGKIEGEFIGIQKGKIETISSIVQNMYKKGFKLDNISEIVNISINELKKILKIN